MSFDDDARRAARDQFRLLGEDAVYTPPSGSPVSCRVIQDPHFVTLGDRGQSMLAQQVNAVMFMKEQIADPRRGGTVVIGALTVTVVDKLPESDRYVTVCSVR